MANNFPASGALPTNVLQVVTISGPKLYRKHLLLFKSSDQRKYLFFTHGIACKYQNNQDNNDEFEHAIKVRKINDTCLKIRPVKNLHSCSGHTNFNLIPKYRITIKKKVK
ncbi:hypothetical protein A8C56_12245 [Niabella ginsenosidivorans]|uniref:Uncharacterized protein n=1 Tax=Niabella ginsenosidivorans TaxID=1176587 RepID=A0A1A9I1W0_9BACT|nr:hypothetical protein A8C56_12245 [Niabella ginsenosidivorans]